MHLDLARLRKRTLDIEFHLDLILFVIYIFVYLEYLAYIYGIAIYVQAALYTLLTVSYATIYLIKRQERGWRMALHGIFVLLLIFFIALFATPAPIISSQLWELSHLGSSFGMYLIFILPLYFIFTLGAYLYRVAGNKRAGSILFALGFAITLILFGLVIGQIRIGDEVYLGYKAVEEMLNGMNPYTTSVANLLYTNISTIGATVTSNNMIIGKIDYPALYFISYTPFYLITSPTLAGVEYVGIKLQLAAFLTLLLLSILYVLDKKELFRFRPAVIIFLALLASTIASAITFLMLALLIISYAKLKSRYVFIPLGLAIAVQQEVWIPVAFLLLYSLNNYGWRKSGRDAIGALSIFLLVNAYFIALGPGAFLIGIFSSIGNIIPFAASPFALFLLYVYNVGLSLSPILVALSALLLAMVLLYWNRKELIPLFGLIPTIFVFHSIVGYYTFFILFLILALSLKPEKNQAGHITKFLHKNRYIFYSAVIAIALVSIAYTCQSHQGYVSQFGVNVTGQSIHFIGNKTVYSANISYSSPINRTLYLFIEGYSANGTKYLLYGFGNQSLIGTTFQCTQSGCPVNINKITLSPYAHVYHLTAVINGSNESDRVTYLDAILYNNEYVYKTQGVYNNTA